MDSNAVVHRLSDMIGAALIAQRSEEYYPQHDADRMDDKIYNCKRRVSVLRKLRDDFEDEMSKPI